MLCYVLLFSVRHLPDFCSLYDLSCFAVATLQINMNDKFLALVTWLILPETADLV